MQQSTHFTTMSSENRECHYIHRKVQVNDISALIYTVLHTKLMAVTQFLTNFQNILPKDSTVSLQ